MGNALRVYNSNDDYIKSNILVGSKYRSTLLENRLMAICMSRIPKASENGEGTITVRIPGSELKELFKLKEYGSLYARLDSTAKKMTGRTIGFSNPESREFEYTAVVTNAKFKDNIFECEFNKNLRKYLKNIESNFTQYSLEIMLSFCSVYSFRLYEVLKSKAYTPKGVPKTNDYEIEYNLSELKLDLGVVNANIDSVKNVLYKKGTPDFDEAVSKSPEKVLERWQDFKTNCLDVAVNEINSNLATRMHVEYTTQKRGRGGKVYGVVFLVHVEPLTQMDDIQVVEKDMSQDDILEEIMDLIGVKLKDARSIAEATDYNLDVIKEKYALTEGKQIDNLTGWMIAAIKNNYTRVGKETFNDFDGRNEDWNKIVEELM